MKSKLAVRAAAGELYTSDLFRKSLAYARRLAPDAIYVLSAKYGLLALDAKVDPYDETLLRMPAAAVRAWADRVLVQLGQVADLRADRFTFLASARYRRYLLPGLGHAEVPMEGLGIGRQLSYLKARTA